MSHIPRLVLDVSDPRGVSIERQCFGGRQTPGYAPLIVTKAGADILDDASASAQRTTLGLGDAAVLAESTIIADVIAQINTDTGGLLAAAAGASDGDLLRFNSGAWERLAIGADAFFLKVRSGLPDWLVI